jgi:enoyl-CoA hydratase/carnithine racemase
LAIDYQKRDGVAYITLNNPAKANILDKATSDEISQAWIGHRYPAEIISYPVWLYF